MKLTFWGTRGSIPTPGPQNRHYGGNTPCLRVQLADGPLQLSSGEVLIIDAGLGIVHLGRYLQEAGFAGTIHLLLTHPHFDHIQGFPFFPLCYQPGTTIVVYGPGNPYRDLFAIFEKQMNPAYSPMNTLNNLPAQIEFHEVHDGERFSIGPVQILARRVPHTFGGTLGFRLEREGRSSLSYIPDAEYIHEPWTEGVAELLEDVDHVIHDFFYFDEEYKEGWGHSSITMVQRILERFQPLCFYPFHYNPDYTDQKIGQALELLQERIRHLPVEIVPSRERYSILLDR